MCFVLLGFATLAAQSVLLREFFSVLYGSDLAFGFALASWTVLTALGAVLGARGGRRWHGVSRWGTALYAAIAAVVLLAVRAWGACEVIPFHAYVLIPVFLAPLCLLGGLLFPAFLTDVPGISAARAYGLEVAGGLAAGLLCAVEFHLGALNSPLIAGLGLVCFAWGWAARAAAPRLRAAVPALAALAGLALPLTPPGRRVECLTLGLRHRRGIVEDTVNTPFSGLAAVRERSGQVAVYENGTPWPAPEATPGRAAVAALLRVLPRQCERAVFVNAHRAGFGPALREQPGGCATRFLETDPAAHRFVRRHLPGDVSPPGERPRRDGPEPQPLSGVAGAPGTGPLPAAVAPFGPDALRAGGGGWDLAAVFGSPPGGLVANLALTAEFARCARSALAPGGAFAIVLPAAPGFTHPGQQAYLDTVRGALRDAFPSVDEFRTQVGWTILAASETPWDRAALRGRLGDRAGGASPDVLAEAASVLRGDGALSVAAVAAGEFGVPPPPSGGAAPPNRVGWPRAYFRYLQFRGAMVEDAPAWWRGLFRERTWGASALALAVLFAAGLATRRGRAVQGVFWAAWGATVTLIVGIYLYQSLAGQVFWAVSLLSAASMGGILAGTRLGGCAPLRAAAPALAAISGGLFPLFGFFQRLPAPAALAALVVLVGGAGLGLGLVFARHCGPGCGAAAGGLLFGVDLLGGGAGLFLGGVVLPWWGGFVSAAALGAAAAAAGVLLDARFGGR